MGWRGIKVSKVLPDITVTAINLPAWFTVLCVTLFKQFEAVTSCQPLFTNLLKIDGNKFWLDDDEGHMRKLGSGLNWSN